MSRRYVVNVRDSYDSAKRLRESFMDRPMERSHSVDWKWPVMLQEVGLVHAVMYSSDKWKKRGAFEDYKHRREGDQYLLVRPGFLVDYQTSDQLSVAGPKVELNGPMPDTFAVLAPILGIQVELYLPNGEPSGEFHQVQIARATLGAAKHPETGETFLLVYSPTALHAIIVGDKLDVTSDGIVG